VCYDLAVRSDSYPGDVSIPIDQPLAGRCGLCAEPVVYAVFVTGVCDIFEPGYGAGGRQRFGMLTDGRVHAQRRHRDNPSTGLVRHRCERAHIEAYDARVPKH
jgi:hypothetical protein